MTGSIVVEMFSRCIVMAYTKLHQSILASTVWLEPHPTRIVWITLLALANKHGEISGTVPGIAHQARVTIGECRAALATFLSPDPDSRTPDDEGRRLIVIKGGWQIINYEKYRLEASKDDEREKTKERVRRFRARLKANAGNALQPLQKDGGNGSETHDRDIAEAEAEADDSSTVRTTESKQESSPANRAREGEKVRASRPTKVTAADFAPPPGRVNGQHPRVSRQEPIPSGWRPSKEAQARLTKALPWITKDIAELRLIEFHDWTAGKLYPPDKLDDVWLGFMVKTDRTKYQSAADQGWNG